MTCSRTVNLRRLFLSVLPALVLFAAGLSAIDVAANDQLPDYYAEGGVSPDRLGDNQLPSEVIDPFTGKLTRAYVDLSIPGQGGFDINVVRSYTNPQDFNQFGGYDPNNYQRSSAGVGWTVHFGRMLVPQTGCVNSATTVADNPVFESSDGRRQMFFRESTFIFISRDRWRAECDPSNGWVVRSPDGVRIELFFSGFPNGGGQPVFYASRIEDRNGNWANITNQSSVGLPYPTQVSTSDGRLVTLSYAGVGMSDFRISSVSAHGRTVTYQHVAAPSLNGFQYLTRVVRSDGLDWEYTYHGHMVANGRRSIDQVTYPNGGTVSYDYDNIVFDSVAPELKTTVVSQKTVSGGGSGTWSFAYNPGSTEDTTTVTYPGGTTVYRHFGAGSAGVGTTWRIGLIRSIQVSDTSVLSATTYTWDNDQISTEPYVRSPRSYAFDNTVLAPKLLQQTIVQNGTYETTYSNFDAYANPGLIEESGPNGHTLVRNLQYFTNSARWMVRGFVSSENIVGVGTVSRMFDADGNVLQENRFGRVVNFTYHPDGNVKSTTDPANNTTNFNQYFRGTAEQVLLPESVSLARNINADGTVQWERDGRNNTTNFLYDGLGRVTRITPPVGSVTNISYGSQSTNITRGTFSETQNVDGFGRATNSTRAGITTNATVDVHGRTVFESYPGQSNGTTYTYDPLGRIKTLRHPDNSTRVFSYIGFNRISVRDERNKTTTYTYQSYGDPRVRSLTVIAAPAGQTTNIVRNKLRLPVLVSQGGALRTYGYDTQFRLTSVNNPENGSVTLGYDTNGNRTSRQVGGLTTFYGYDDLNRLVSINYPSPSSRDATLGYDKNNNLINVDNGDFEWTYRYTANNVLDRETLVSLWPGPSQRTLETTYTINSLDHVSQVQYPSGRVLSLSPDTLGRPTRVGSFATSIAWHPSGQLSSMTLGNGRTTQITYDSRLRPSTYRTSGVPTANAIDFSYGYDVASNLTSLNDNRVGAPDVSMTYDDLNRLDSAVGDWGTNDLAYTTTGNITGQGLFGANLGYTYSQERLTQVTGATRPYSFSYDGYGNVIDDGVYTFSWDDAGNLLQIPEANVLYQYDGNGRRVSADTDQGTVLVFIDRQGRKLGEYNTADAGSREYIYAGRRMIARVED